MRIGIIGSMQYTEKMLNVRDELIELGHDTFVTKLHEALVGKSDEEKEKIKIHQKNNMDAIREFWNAMQRADASWFLILINTVLRITSAATLSWKSDSLMF